MPLKQINFFLAAVLVGYAGTTGAVEQTECPEKFLKSESGECFHIFRDVLLGNSPAVTWHQARDLCRGMGGSGWTADLAWTVTTDTLMEFNDYIVEHEPDMDQMGYIYWVGAHRATANGHWEWTDGQRVDLTSYIWLADAPYNHYDLAYGMLVPAGAYDRHYMYEYQEGNVGPSFICQAAPLCTTQQ